jgi:hypothetical protein
MLYVRVASVYCYATSIISQSEKISLYQMLLHGLYINAVLWLANNYFNYFDQFKFVFETVDSCLSVSHFMHEKFEADTLDLCPPYSLSGSGLSTKQNVSQLSFSGYPYLSVCSFPLTCLMPRLTLEQVKAHQREAIRLRTERRVAELKVEQGKRDWEEVLTLCALLWLCLRVCCYAKLYFL